MSKPKPYKLNQQDILWSWQSTRIGKRRKLSRASAAVDSISLQLSLKHQPTDREVKGEIPEGHYSNKQKKKLKEELWAELQEKLRLAVAKHLRLPGR